MNNIKRQAQTGSQPTSTYECYFKPYSPKKNTNIQLGITTVVFLAQHPMFFLVITSIASHATEISDNMYIIGIRKTDM